MRGYSGLYSRFLGVSFLDWLRLGGVGFMVRGTVFR